MRSRYMADIDRTYATIPAWRPLRRRQQLPAPPAIASPLRPMDMISTTGLSWLCNLMMQWTVSRASPREPTAGVGAGDYPSRSPYTAGSAARRNSGNAHLRRSIGNPAAAAAHRGAYETQTHEHQPHVAGSGTGAVGTDQNDRCEMSG